MSHFDEFRAAADKVLSPFLAPHGFRREPSLEETDLLLASVVYVGKHVGLRFVYDVREDSVTDEVVRVENGAIKDFTHGGYSKGLFSHLVKHAGYRGGQHRNPRPPGMPRMEREFALWVDILTVAGQTLLADQPNSLP